MSHALGNLGEFGLIEAFRRTSAGGCQGSQPFHPWLDLGIGDDCAALDIGGNQRLLITTDMLLDRVHFLRGRMQPYQIGWKAMAVNISDIAAMGGEPKAAVLAMGLPPDTRPEEAAGLRQGLQDSAREYKVDLIGGDTVLAKSDLTLCLSLFGTVSSSQMLRRSGARPGDRILVGGCLGDSAAGLALLLGELSAEPALAEPLLAAHCQPRPQVALGRWLANTGQVHALIDISDGLLQDLGHICEESGTGADIEAERVPLSPAVRGLADRSGRDALEWALAGGEDYVLLACVAPEGCDRLIEHARQDLGLALSDIGVITAEKRLRLGQAGVFQVVPPKGYDAFRVSAGD